jgi:hypothetical protein
LDNITAIVIQVTAADDGQANVPTSETPVVQVR